MSIGDIIKKTTILGALSKDDSGLGKKMKNMGAMKGEQAGAKKLAKGGKVPCPPKMTKKPAAGKMPKGFKKGK